MNYFLDTEFLEGFHKPVFGRKAHFIDLISIGLAAEDGREYYAISKDFDLKRVWNTWQENENLHGRIKKRKENRVYWHRENILRSIHEDLSNRVGYYGQLFHSDLYLEFSYQSLKNLIKWFGKTNDEISQEIKYFTGGQIDDFTGWYWNEKPEFFAYFADYDWVLFCSLFGKMIDLPKGWPMHCIDLKQELDSWGLGKEWKRENCPEPTIEHNALEDAKWNKRLHEALVKRDAETDINALHLFMKLGYSEKDFYAAYSSIFSDKAFELMKLNIAGHIPESSTPDPAPDPAHIKQYKMAEKIQLDVLVFPSEEKTISVTRDEAYGGAHHYEIKNCVGFNNGKTDYVDSTQTVQFVQKNDDGTMVPGVQSEQLVIVLLDRAVKLNNRFPSAQNEKMIAGLNMFLDACQERVQERIDRGVMGDLKK